MPLPVVATDDVGVAELELHAEVVQRSEPIEPLVADATWFGQTSVEHVFTWDLSQLSLQEGDLLAVRSDAYRLTDDFRVELHPARQHTPVVVELDPAHFKLISQLDDRFPHGAPSLRQCDRLTVRGNVRFGKNITVRGRVTVENPSPEPMTIPDGTVLE